MENLTINANTVEGIPEWREETELLTLDIDLHLHEDLKYHLEKVKIKENKNNLKEEITSLQQEIITHNKKIETFRKGIRPIVTNKFEENGIIQSKEPEEGFYVDEYGNLLNKQLSNIIRVFKENPNLNENELREKIHWPFKRNDNGFISMLGEIVGKIEKPQTEKFGKILNDIPFDKAIINELTGSYKEVLKIKEKSGKITKDLEEIIDKIERNRYKEKAKCCPKLFFFFKSVYHYSHSQSSSSTYSLSTFIPAFSAGGFSFRCLLWLVKVVV